MTTTSELNPQRKPIRPNSLRRFLSIYIDGVLCFFSSWIIANVSDHFHWVLELSLVFYLVEIIFCKLQLWTTIGEFCVGIRYLTSSSKQVVADIQIIHPKLMLNPFLIIAGSLEFTFSVLFFSGWTFFHQILLGNYVFSNSISITFWIGEGILFFLSSVYLWSGLKLTIVLIPLIHLFDFLLFLIVLLKWHLIFHANHLSLKRWPHLLSHYPNIFEIFVIIFGIWSLILILGILISKRQLINS